MRSVGWMAALLITFSTLLNCSGNEHGSSAQLLQGLELSSNDDLLTLTVTDPNALRSFLSEPTPHLIQNGASINPQSASRDFDSCALSGVASEFAAGERIPFVTRREGDKLAATSLNGGLKLLCAKADSDANDWSLADLNAILGSLASASGELFR